jgi:hypothetical protein
MDTQKKIKKIIPVKRNGIYYIPTVKDEKPKGHLAVTEILGKSVAKPALQYWVGKMAAQIALEDPTLSEKEVMSKVGQISGKAASRGRTVHSLAEASDVKGTIIDVAKLPPEIRPYMEAFNKFKGDMNPKLIHNEEIVFNKTHGYAGTLDRIYEINNKRALVDLKTSKDFYRDMSLQLSAYKHAEFIYTKDKKIIPFPEMDNIYILLLGDDGNYAIRQMKDSFSVFLSAFDIYKFLNPDKLATK